MRIKLYSRNFFPKKSCAAPSVINNIEEYHLQKFIWQVQKPTSDKSIIINERKIMMLNPLDYMRIMCVQFLLLINVIQLQISRAFLKCV